MEDFDKGEIDRIVLKEYMKQQNKNKHCYDLKSQKTKNMGAINTELDMYFDKASKSKFLAILEMGRL